MMKWLSTGKKGASQGQAAIIAIAITLLVALIVMGGAISNMALFNANRTIAIEKSLETYYIAQAGIREAISSRMIPRTNYLNFVPPATRQANGMLNPVYQLSGRVFERPNTTPPTNLVGIYRYFILGGDPSRNPDSTDLGNKQYWPTNNPNLLDNTTRQPFYVVSRGAVCRERNTKRVMFDSVSYTPAGGTVCSNNYELDQMTLVAKVDMSNANPGCNGLSCVETLRYFNAETFRADRPLYVSFNGATQLAGANTDLPFEPIWNKSNATPGDSAPAAIAFYSPSDTIPGSWSLIGAPGQTQINNVPTNTIMRLMFNGNIDMRVIGRDSSGTAVVSGPQGVAACQADPTLCYFQIWRLRPDGTPDQIYNNIQPIPVVPGSSQVVLFPPADFSSALTSGSQYELRILPSVPSYDGRPASTGTTPWSIRFTAQ
jgi:hypothetical protein